METSDTFRQSPFSSNFSRTHYPFLARDAAAQRLINKYSFQTRPAPFNGEEQRTNNTQLQDVAHTSHTNSEAVEGNIQGERPEAVETDENNCLLEMSFGADTALYHLISRYKNLRSQRVNEVVRLKFFCEKEIARKLIDTVLTDAFCDKYNSIDMSYTGKALVFESDEPALLYFAVTEILNEADGIYGRITRNYTRTLFSSDLEYKGENVCIICNNEIIQGEKIIATSCLHIFHRKCIIPWLKQKKVCPIDKYILRKA